MIVRDSEFERLLAEWLENDASVAPGAPVDAAVEFARAHPRRRDWLAFLRRDAMTARTTEGLRPTAILIVAASLLALAIGGTVLIGSDPDPTPRPASSAAPSLDSTPLAAQPIPDDTTVESDNNVALAPGRYTGGLVGPGEPMVGDAEVMVDVEFTVGEGWSISQPMGGATCCWYINGDRRSISYWPVSNIYPDACDTGTVMDPPIGPTVDDLVNALDAQQNTEMSDPVEVTVGGYSGKRFDMTPANPVSEFCADVLSLWPDLGGDPGRGVVVNGGPGEDTQPVYVIDVEGNRVVFVAWSTGTDPADATAIAEVMESMEFSIR